VRRLLSLPYLEITTEETEGTTFRFTVADNSDLKLDFSPDSEAVLKPLVEKVSAWLGEKMQVIAACHQRGQTQRLYELLAHYPLSHALRTDFPPSTPAATASWLSSSADLPRPPQEDRLVVIAEEEIRPADKTPRHQRKSSLTSLAELGWGLHGAPRLRGHHRGLQHIPAGEGTSSS
jgi:transcription-repair coupling factor (superfamily II helicase)